MVTGLFVVRLFLFLGSLAFGLTVYFFFTVSAKVETLRKKENHLTTEINRHKEVVHTLRAEWAYLSNPINIEKMVEQHLRQQREGEE